MNFKKWWNHYRNEMDLLRFSADEILKGKHIQAIANDAWDAAIGSCEAAIDEVIKSNHQVKNQNNRPESSRKNLDNQ